MKKVSQPNHGTNIGKFDLVDVKKSKYFQTSRQKTETYQCQQ